MGRGRSFAACERFIGEVEARKLRPAYILIGDEVFLSDRCRAALIQHLVAPDLRDFSIHEVDLAMTGIFELLDRARNPSLMAPFQVFFVRGLKLLYGRGSHSEEFAAIEAYCAGPNPDAVLIFIADHISVPVDVRRMEMTSRERYDRIRETLGHCCSIIELAGVEQDDGVRWVIDYAARQGVEIGQETARELVDALACDMMMISNELEKLLIYAGNKKSITPTDVEVMVSAAKQRSIYELTDAISAKDRPRALAAMDAILNHGGGEEAAIGHVYMLAKTFRQMLIIVEKNVRDARTIWQVLWPGFRMPPFAAEDIIRQARRYKSRNELAQSLEFIARADLALRSNPASKRMVMENLVLQLSSPSKETALQWEQRVF